MASKLRLRMQGAAKPDDNAPTEDAIPAEDLRRFAENYVRTGDAKRAARATWPTMSGVTASFKGAIARKDPRVVQWIEEIGDLVRRNTAYDAKAAFLETGEILREATLDRNWNSAIKAVELRARLANLLTEHVDVQVTQNLGLRKALEARHAFIARERAAMLVEDVQIITPALAAPTTRRVDPAFAPEPIDVFS